MCFDIIAIGCKDRCNYNVLHCFCCKINDDNKITDEKKVEKKVKIVSENRYYRAKLVQSSRTMKYTRMEVSSAGVGNGSLIPTFTDGGKGER